MTEVALVTGAGSGIGKATAVLLASRGYMVGVLGHTEAEIAVTAQEIRARGGEAILLRADISSENEMRKAVDDLVGKAGRLDVVVANAGVNGVWAPIDDLTLEEWNRTIAINLTGTFLTMLPA